MLSQRRLLAVAWNGGNLNRLDHAFVRDAGRSRGRRCSYGARPGRPHPPALVGRPPGRAVAWRRVPGCASARRPSRCASTRSSTTRRGSSSRSRPGTASATRHSRAVPRRAAPPRRARRPLPRQARPTAATRCASRVSGSASPSSTRAPATRRPAARWSGSGARCAPAASTTAAAWPRCTTCRCASTRSSPTTQLDQGFLAGRVVTIEHDLGGAGDPVALYDGHRYPLRPVDPVAASRTRRRRVGELPPPLSSVVDTVASAGHGERLTICGIRRPTTRTAEWCMRSHARPTSQPRAR